jgi:hypothetical protein
MEKTFLFRVELFVQLEGLSREGYSPAGSKVCSRSFYRRVQQRAAQGQLQRQRQNIKILKKNIAKTWLFNLVA